MNDPSTHDLWHVAADGTVLQQWRRDDGRVQYGRAWTTRPVTLDELATLDERVGTAGRSADRTSNLCMGLAVLGLVGGLLGWLLLPAVGVDGGAALVVVGISVLLLLVGVCGVYVVPRRLLATVTEAYTDAGFESMEPKVLKEDEARLVIDAPGTRSASRRLTA